MNYFWDHGYDNSSLEKLLKAMKIKKSSFYSTFRSKEELFSRCLDLYRKEMLSQLNMREKEIGPKATMLMMASSVIQELKETGKVRGCLLINSSQESYNKYNNLSHQIAMEYSFFINLFIEFVEKSKKLGEIKSKRNSRMIAGRYTNTIKGLIVGIQAGMAEDMMDDIVESSKEILQ